ncbi:MAG: hypothetical protein GY797_12245 [Deltaproteobacteria bacterium]|nr:hypothetical protein [Deltaproteobacteria bacterium]
MKTLLLAMTVCAILTGRANFKTESVETKDLPILFAAFDDHFEVGQDATELILSIYLGVDGLNPSIHFLSAFRKRYPNVLFYLFTKSKLNEKNEVIDYTSGRKATNIEFSSVKWLSESEAKVELGWFCHPTFSGADLYRLRKEGNTWRIIGKKKLFRT